MILRIMLAFITGFVNIQIEGFYIERFINLCISKRILMWNMKRRNSSILTANISIEDYKKLKNIVKKTKCKTKIKKKCGVPFLLYKYKKRKIFAILLALVVVLILILSNFIWNIEISGLENIPKDEFEKLVNDKGIKIGKFKGEINLKDVINEIRMSRDDIAWVRC